jgi:hypothetical protein
MFEGCFVMTNDGDCRPGTRGIGNDTGEESAERESGVTPEAIDADGRRAMARLHRIGHRCDERRVHEGCSDPEESSGYERWRERPATEDEHGQAA